MKRVQLLRGLGLALATIVIVAIGVVGFTMHHSAATVHASGSGEGGPCFVPTGGAPTCQFKGFTATADYSNYDTTTCPSGVYTYYSVYAADNVQIDPSASTTGGPLVGVFYSQWNSCTYSYSSYYGETTTATIKTTGDLGSATAQANIQLQDWNYNPGPALSVNVTWTGYGDLSTTVDTISFRTGDTMYKSRFSGSNRMAAVNGTISDGSSTYTITTTGSMYDAQGGTILIQHS